MNAINVNNIIENYLNGTASKAEEIWLLGEMETDKNLTSEVELRRRTNKILEDRRVIELRNKLEVIEFRKRSLSPVKRTAIRVAKYAAAVACIALISSALYFPFRSTPADHLYNKYYSAYELPGTVRSAGTESNIMMRNAINSYKAHDYKTAISYLEKILGSGVQNVESEFIYGMANMGVHNYPVASKSFSKVIQQNDNLYIEDAAWYLGLCYMMNNETDKAVRQFEYISASKSRYSKEARKLARKLK